MNEKPLKIIFAGTSEFAAKHLDAIVQTTHSIIAVLTQPDKPAGRGQELKQSPVKELATEYHLPVYQPETLKSEAIQKILRDLQADVIIVVAYGFILPKEVLEIPKLGCFNIHASLLPRWRGASPIQQAILAGDKETGITIIQMVEKLDAGDMVLQKSCEIKKTDNAKTLTDRLSQLGQTTIIEFLELLKNKNIHSQQQDETQVTYAHKILKKDGELNWEKEAIELERQIRAFDPWPIAYMKINHETIRVFEAKVLDEMIKESPGKIIQATHDGLEIATAKGILRITKMQFPGGKILPFADVLNSKKDFFETK